MYPILLDLPGFILYTQTVFFIIAFIAGLLISGREAARFGITRLDVSHLALWSFLGAIVGARLLFMMLNYNVAVFTLREFCTLGALDGGFSFHGGLLAGGLVGVVIAWREKLPVWRFADIFAPGLAAATFFMRLGCLCNGCDYGVAATVAWAIPLHGTLRHPIQLYEGFGNLLLLPLLIRLNRKPLRSGQTFLIYLMASAIIRVVSDFYREESVRMWNYFTMPQLLAMIIAVSAFVIMIHFILRRASS